MPKPRTFGYWATDFVTVYSDLPGVSKRKYFSSLGSWN